MGYAGITHPGGANENGMVADAGRCLSMLDDTLQARYIDLKMEISPRLPGVIENAIRRRHRRAWK